MRLSGDTDLAQGAAELAEVAGAPPRPLRRVVPCARGVPPAPPGLRTGPRRHGLSSQPVSPAPWRWGRYEPPRATRHAAAVPGRVPPTDGSLDPGPAPPRHR